jgi:hypothetical protein
LTPEQWLVTCLNRKARRQKTCPRARVMGNEAIEWEIHSTNVLLYALVFSTEGGHGTRERVRRSSDKMCHGQHVANAPCRLI